MELTEAIARQFARIALGHVGQEYPNKLDHVMDGDGDVRTPRDLHPVFFGSFDWHSCVHSWWTLLTLRRLLPDMPEAREIEALADATFTKEKLSVELAYLERPSSRGFERPYGWGWLLCLHLEAERHTDRPWGGRMSGLANAFAARLSDYLPLLTYPITVGTHANTAFALLLAREWASDREQELLSLIDKWSVHTFEKRTDYSGWEPGGDEFLSPVLTAALLMSRVMPSSEFAGWLDRLVLENGWIERECHPVTVSDRSDGKIAHLDGLNLSRAWCLLGLAKALGEGAPPILRERAREHMDAAMPHVSGDYMGEHWLSSFALLALLEAR
ncbi:hypothetical protein NAP1_03795 [Erythrobacter sp. NAP1]|uniref:DUF2891 domain-containing protein n=1 Tax=Erythrobacter sp. NAP1 TaxID=237727 RepID=UPI0000686B6F|nr:DUF2891 domain-containing protein [Erythrobacter sp. NAP1]EAQ29865.1 hypothetical protein NAP1_03795 [Erythrobacter sp. NAP1]